MSLASAYHARHMAKKMNHGGMCAEGCDMLHEHKYADGGEVEENHMPEPSPSPAEKGKSISDAFKSAGGVGSSIRNILHGILGEEEAKAEEHADGGMVGDIMAKRYSHGGQVANKTGFNADFHEDQFDDLVLRDDLESEYTGANSGDELGNAQKDEDERDLVSMIMRSRHKKDRLPRPA